MWTSVRAVHVRTTPRARTRSQSQAAAALVVVCKRLQAALGRLTRFLHRVQVRHWQRQRHVRALPMLLSAVMAPALLGARAGHPTWWMTLVQAAARAGHLTWWMTLVQATARAGHLTWSTTLSYRYVILMHPRTALACARPGACTYRHQCQPATWMRQLMGARRVLMVAHSWMRGLRFVTLATAPMAVANAHRDVCT